MPSGEHHGPPAGDRAVEPAALPVHRSRVHGPLHDQPRDGRRLPHHPQGQFPPPLLPSRPCTTPPPSSSPLPRHSPPPLTAIPLPTFAPTQVDSLRLSRLDAATTAPGWLPATPGASALPPSIPLPSPPASTPSASSSPSTQPLSPHVLQQYRAMASSAAQALITAKDELNRRVASQSGSHTHTPPGIQGQRCGCRGQRDWLTGGLSAGTCAEQAGCGGRRWRLRGHAGARRQERESHAASTPLAPAAPPARMLPRLALPVHS